MRSWLRGLGALALLWLVPPSRGGAEPRPLRFDHLTVESGLSNSMVLDILEDRRGFLWFATADGLNRYDGARFNVYRHDPGDPGSLPSQRVEDLLEDDEGRLWLALGGAGGLGLYDPKMDGFRHIEIRSSRTPERMLAIKSLARDRRGRLWLGTAEGLRRFDPRTRDVRAIRHDPADAQALSDDVVRRVAIDRDGAVWAATARGLDRVDPESGLVRRWPRHGDAADVLASADVSDVHVAPDGELWATTLNAGLVRYRAAGDASRYVASPSGETGLLTNVLECLTADPAGRLYIGTENGGLNVLEPRSGRISRYRPALGDPTALGADSIRSLFVDSAGTLWVGTFNGGVDYSSRFTRRFDVIRAGSGGLGAPSVSAVIQDRVGNLWVGTDAGGLHRFDRDGGAPIRYTHEPSTTGGLAANAVLALHEDSTGVIWIGTWEGGLQALDPRTGRLTTFRRHESDPDSLASNSVWSLAEDSRGRLFVALQDGGVAVLERGSRRFVPLRRLHPSLARQGVVNQVVRGSGDDLWLAHDFAERLDLRTGRVVAYHFDAPGVSSIRPDSRGNVWFGTSAAGLYCLVAGSSSMFRVTTADGLPSDSIRSIVEDDAGDIWLGTARGLVRLEGAARAPARSRVRVFDLRDGLPGYEFGRAAAFRSPAGEIFFGTQRGLVRFFPEAIELNPRVPRVVLTGLRILNRPVAPGSPESPLKESITGARELVLSPRDSVVTFEFSALDFVAPRKNRYRYRLFGFDRDWHQTNRPTATYTNLPAGRYRLRVLGTNNDGLWNVSGAELDVVQRAPLHRTVPFWLLVCTGLCAGGLAAHRVRLRRHLRAETRLQERLRVATAEVRTLSGLLPVCPGCRRVRDDRGYWGQLEAYVQERTNAEFSHGICPDCKTRFLGEGPRLG